MLVAGFAGIIIAADAAKPDFTLKNLSGTEVTLSGLAGSVVVIDFWAMWCKSCKEAFPELNKLNKDYAAKNVKVMGIDLENAKPEKIAAFAKNAGIEYEILLDPKGTTTKTFSITGVPSLAIIKPDGTIAKVFRGMNKQTEKDIRALLDSLTQTQQEAK